MSLLHQIPKEVSHPEHDIVLHAALAMYRSGLTFDDPMDHFKRDERPDYIAVYYEDRYLDFEPAHWWDKRYHERVDRGGENLEQYINNITWED